MNKALTWLLPFYEFSYAYHYFNKLNLPESQYTSYRLISKNENDTIAKAWLQFVVTVTTL